MSNTKKIIIAVLILLFFILIGCAIEEEPNIGDTITLFESPGNVPIFKTYDASKKFSEAGIIGLTELEYVNTELIRSGEKFYVKNGTKALILNTKVFADLYEIRILTGSKEGVKGWVAQSYAERRNKN